MLATKTPTKMAAARKTIIIADAQQIIAFRCFLTCSMNTSEYISPPPVSSDYSTNFHGCKKASSLENNNVLFYYKYIFFNLKIPLIEFR